MKKTIYESPESRVVKLESAGKFLQVSNEIYVLGNSYSGDWSDDIANQ